MMQQVLTFDFRETVHREIEKILRCNDPRPLDELERDILLLLSSHLGRQHAITAAEIAQALGMPAGEASRRLITDAVRSLRITFRAPIGAAKGPHPGYFIICDAEDQRCAAAHLAREIRRLAEAHRALAGPKATVELLGQLRLQTQEEERDA
jgi:hypothetical protein